MPKKSLKSFFLQFMCGSSINDAVKHTKLPDSPTYEPSSPKISWTGQIKRKSTTTTTTTTTSTNDNNHHNSDINNTSSRFLASTINVKSCSHSTRYSIFSVKNLITSPAIDVAPINKPLGHSNRHTNVHHLFSSKNTNHPAIDVASIKNKVVLKRSNSWDGRRRIKSRSKKYYKNSSDDQDIEKDMAIGYLETPLPVVKCPPRDQEANVNLGKRRGFQMKSLQIEPMQVAIDRHCNNNNGAFSVPTSATIFG